MLFSQEFDITRTRADDWFDPILESDTELFVDPFLIFKDTASRWSGAHDELVAHFDRIFMLLAKSGLRSNSPYWHQGVNLLRFPEPRPFCLGYTARGTRGAGGGEGLAKIIASAMRAAIERGMTHLDHFEVLGIFNERIGPDRISDLTCTILKQHFIDYTRRVATRHSLTTKRFEIANAGADTNGQWNVVHADLPVNPFTAGPIILTPRKFLRRLPTLNAEDWWQFYGVKAGLNVQVMEGADKQEIVRQANFHRTDVWQFVEQKSKSAADPYDVEKDDDLVWKWEPLTHEWVERHPVTLKAKTAAEFFGVIDTVIGQFQQYVENEGGWRLLWNDDKTPRSEEASQNLFRGIAKHYCNANDFAIDREVNLGRGPVDFKFSRGSSLKADLEVKLLHNGRFWHGLATQLPIYMKADETTDGWLLAIQTRSGGVSRDRARKLPAEVKAVAKAQGLNLRYGLVDARRKESASNAYPPRV